MELSYPPVFIRLTDAERSVTQGVLTLLANTQSVNCIVWGGSTTLPHTLSRWRDIDLWVVTSDPRLVRDRLATYKEHPDISFTYPGGRFPWFGELVSLFFFPDSSFSIDVGICSQDDLRSANAGPDPTFVWSDGTIDHSLFVSQTYSIAPDASVARILIHLLKLRKSVDRGHVLNAVEVISWARSDYIGLLKSKLPLPSINYSRASRGAEDILDRNTLTALGETCPQPSCTSVAECGARIGNMTLEWLRRNETHTSLWHQLQDITLWLEQYGSPARFEQSQPGSRSNPGDRA